MPGQQILRQQQQLDYLYILLSGSLQIGWLQANGELKTNDFLGHYTAFNLVALLQNQPVSFDYFTLGRVEVAIICKTEFLQILQTNAQASWSILQVLSKRMYNLFEQNRYLKTASLSQRMARHLLSLQSQYGIKQGQKGLIQFKISQQEFSELFNVSRQTINKHLQYLMQDGLIEWNYSQVKILNLDKLQQLSELS
ncbi:hypothetical protein BS636_10445 [Acinetobacter sp. LoGeW2-3]|uniref:Crp/Fnr family transcriptional regulator n=1 Tax=Acinetobacter sp. LoGeW2-3 TaxID=1808001 RepID=UPI000C05BC48|nr:Crp/Fnr family transcriptional regulator [Acinetobacter sp. LoGeW2-3]ATO20045.1 hypothetical protein BS636_10445 [Acinetobacter sp. LoGeW2-3]